MSKTESKSYSVFTISDGDSCKDYTVEVFPGKLYRVIFYDTDGAKVVNTVGQVTMVDSNALYLESMKAIDSTTCLCESREFLNKVVSIYKVAIPVRNIYSIYPITEEEAKKPPKPPVPKERSVSIVGVLGISAEICRSVVVRVRVYSDDRAPDYEVVPVDMKVGNIYNVAYFSRKDCTMYEVKGKLIDIRVMPKFEGDTKLNGFVRDEMPEEIVGLGNTIYDADHFHKLNKESPEGERVRFTFDTSEDFSGFYDHVWLKDIRNIDLVEEGKPSPDPVDPEVNTCPNAETCPIIHGEKPPVPPSCRPPHGCDDGRHYPHHSHWDPPMNPPHHHHHPHHLVNTICCPLTNMPIDEDTNCGDCEKLDECPAFEDYTNMQG